MNNIDNLSKSSSKIDSSVFKSLFENKQKKIRHFSSINQLISSEDINFKNNSISELSIENLDDRFLASGILQKKIEFVKASTLMISMMEGLKNKYQNLVPGTNNNSFGKKDRDIINDSMLLWTNSLLKFPVDKFSKIGAGLVNMGNTCFLNSTIQSLLYTPPLLNMLCHEDFKKCLSQTFCMICELHKQATECFMKTGQSVKPLSILQNLKQIAKHMKWGRQEDSHEFLRYAIEAIQKAHSRPHDEIVIDSEIRKMAIYKIFLGTLKNRIYCLECKHESIKLDPFLDLCLDVRAINTIEAGLEKFTRSEILSGDNSYFCFNCKKKGKAKKSLKIHKSPMVLTVQFKRYSATGMKMSQHIRFPEELVLDPFTTIIPNAKNSIIQNNASNSFSNFHLSNGNGTLNNSSNSNNSFQKALCVDKNKSVFYNKNNNHNCFNDHNHKAMDNKSNNNKVNGYKNDKVEVYNLYSVLIHDGYNTLSGHYYSYVKGPDNNWYCMNDASVYQVPLQRVLSAQAYIVFYLKKNKPLPKKNLNVINENLNKIILPHSTSKNKSLFNLNITHKNINQYCIENKNKFEANFALNKKFISTNNFTKHEDPKSPYKSIDINEGSTNCKDTFNMNKLKGTLKVNNKMENNNAYNLMDNNLQNLKKDKLFNNSEQFTSSSNQKGTLNLSEYLELETEKDPLILKENINKKVVTSLSTTKVLDKPKLFNMISSNECLSSKQNLKTIKILNKDHNEKKLTILKDTNIEYISSPDEKYNLKKHRSSDRFLEIPSQIKNTEVNISSNESSSLNKIIATTKWKITEIFDKVEKMNTKIKFDINGFLDSNKKSKMDENINKSSSKESSDAEEIINKKKLIKINELKVENKLEKVSSKKNKDSNVDFHKFNGDNSLRDADIEEELAKRNSVYGVKVTSWNGGESYLDIIQKQKGKRKNKDQFWESEIDLGRQKKNRSKESTKMWNENPYQNIQNLKNNHSNLCLS